MPSKIHKHLFGRQTNFNYKAVTFRELSKQFRAGCGLIT